MKLNKLDIEEIKEAIGKTSKETAIYVGSDSKCYTVNKQKMVAYITVVVLHIDGNKGAKVFKGLERKKHYGNLRQRLMEEVSCAVSTAYELIEVIADRPFQLHLDINPDPKHKSSSVVKEAVGYTMGMLNFKPHIKPDSIMASNCADKWAKLCAK